MQVRVSRVFVPKEQQSSAQGFNLVSTLGTRRMIPNRPARGGRFEIARDINIISFNAASGDESSLAPSSLDGTRFPGLRPLAPSGH